MAPTKLRKVYALIAAGCCLTFLLLLVGSWNYWFPFVTDRAWYETDDIPMPEMLQFLSDVLNEGNVTKSCQDSIPYMALPIGMALLTWRFLQMTWQILTRKLDRLIAGHEVEEEIEAMKEELKQASEALEPKMNRDKGE